MRAIVCATIDWKIGHHGELLYHIPEDLRRFKVATYDMTVVMGRKTFESLPDRKPLEGRRNIILSRSMPKPPEGFDLIHDPAGFIPDWERDPSIWLIGGGQIFEQYLRYCSDVLVTRVLETRPDATDEMPNLALHRMHKNSFDHRRGNPSYQFEHWVNLDLAASCGVK